MIKLHIDSVTKTFNNHPILSDVYLSCQQGEIQTLLGKNGSGKFTLLKIVFGTENADSKFVRVGDKIIRTISDRRNLINYLPQESFLPSSLKVKTLIKLFLSKENRNIVCSNEYVKPLLDKKAHLLSTGERRVIEILLVIHSEARFILLDEPFNGISPIMRDYITSYIKKMKFTKGFILTDHDYENAINLADKILFLNNGYLKTVKDKDELVGLGYLSKATFIKVYKVE